MAYDKPYTGPPATLASMLRAGLAPVGRLPGMLAPCPRRYASAEGMATRYGQDTPLPYVMARLTCRDCRGPLDMRVHVPGPTWFAESGGCSVKLAWRGVIRRISNGSISLLIPK